MADISLRYGADASPRIDVPTILESPAPLRVGNITVTNIQSTTVPSPFSVGADTGCTNASLRVFGGIHATTVLGIG